MFRAKSIRARSVFILIVVATITLACNQASDAPVETTISNTELAGRIEAGTAPIILDVRSADEYQAGHIPGSINIPHDQLSQRLSELESSTSEEIVVYCRSGRRASLAEAELANAQFTRVRDLEGHMKAWQAAALPVSQ